MLNESGIIDYKNYRTNNQKKSLINENKFKFRHKMFLVVFGLSSYFGYKALENSNLNIAPEVKQEQIDNKTNTNSILNNGTKEIIPYNGLEYNIEEREFKTLSTNDVRLNILSENGGNNVHIDFRLLDTSKYRLKIKRWIPLNVPGGMGWKTQKKLTRTFPIDDIGIQAISNYLSTLNIGFNNTISKSLESRIKQKSLPQNILPIKNNPTKKELLDILFGKCNIFLQNIPKGYKDIVEKESNKFHKKDEITSASLKNAYNRISKGDNLKILYNLSVKYKIPFQISLLTIQESYFDPNADSGLAVGYWQLNKKIGKKYGAINKGIDNRKNLEISSEAAIQYLIKIYKSHFEIINKRKFIVNKDDYSDTNIWLFAMTEYNRGNEARKDNKILKGNFSGYYNLYKSRLKRVKGEITKSSYRQSMKHILGYLARQLAIHNVFKKNKEI